MTKKTVYQEHDEINLIELWRMLADYKKHIILITALSVLIAVLVILFMTPVYRAEALLSPVVQDEGDQLATMANQFSGLASIAGINIPATGSTSNEAIAMLKSRDFTISFINDNKLMPILFKNQMKSKTPPNSWDAYELFNRIRTVSTDRQTGLITLSIEWSDPAIASDWVNQLVWRINARLKNEAITKAKKSIKYLNDQLDKTSVIGVKQSIYKLIEVQTKKMMFAHTRDEYAFRVIDKAIPPDKSIRPNYLLIIMLSMISGLIVGFAWVLISVAIKRNTLR